MTYEPIIVSASMAAPTPPAVAAVLHALSTLLLWGSIYMLLMLQTTPRRVASITMVCTNCMIAMVVARITKRRNPGTAFVISTLIVISSLIVHVIPLGADVGAVIQFWIAAINCLVLAAKA